MLKTFRASNIVALGLLLGLSLAENADAQEQVVSAFYEDAKDTIQLVIQDELALSAAKYMSCTSPHGFLRYYEPTLTALHDRRYKALKRAVRSDSAALTGSFVLNTLKGQKTSPLDFFPLAYSEAGQLDKMNVCLDQWDPEEPDGRAVAKSEEHKKTITANQSPAKYRALQDPEFQVVPLSECRSELSWASAEEALRCELALAAEAIVLGEKESFRLHLIRGSSAPVAELLVKAGMSFPDAWQTAADLANQIEGGQKLNADALLEVFAASFPALSAGTQAFSSPNWTKEQGALVLALQELAQAGSITVSIGGVSHGVPFELVLRVAELTKDPQQFVRRLVESLGGSGSLEATVAISGGKLTISVGSVDGAIGGVGLQQLPVVLLGAEYFQKLRALGIQGLAQFRKYEKHIDVLKKVIAAWKGAQSSNWATLDTLNAIETTVRFSEAALNCTAAGGQAICKVLKNARDLAASGAARDLIEASRDNEGASALLAGLQLSLEAAHAAVEEAKTKDKCGTKIVVNGTCGDYEVYLKDIRLLEALVVSLGAYLTTAEGLPDDAVREATRDALYNWLVARRPNKGYFDKSVGEWLNVSFGMSWNNGYVNSEQNGARWVASMEALSVMASVVKKRHTYFGMQFSLLNLLGPISEIALRNPETSYLHSGWVWANFVQPRADFIIASPAFSKRLALFAGVSGRAAVVFPTDSDNHVPYTYATPFSRTDVARHLNAGTIIPQFLEFGLGLRYYPF